MAKCKKINVGKGICYIRFDGKTSYSLDEFAMRSRNEKQRADGIEYCNVSLYTARGEQMIIDFDRYNRVVGIELLSSKKAVKRCQCGKGQL